MKKLIVLCVVCVLVGPANAGIWTYTHLTDATVMPTLDTSGDLFKASNLGLGAAAQSIDGIPYDIDYSNISGVAEPDDNVARALYTGSDPLVANLLNTGGQITKWAAEKEMIIELSGLTVGYDYRFQFLTSGSASSMLDLWGDKAGDNTYKYLNVSASSIDMSLVTFEWTASTAVTTMQLMGNVNGTTYTSILGYTVHETVPEPATMVLLGLGSLIGLKRRK